MFVRIAADPEREWVAFGPGEMRPVELEKQMKDAAGKWEFEKAAMLRDQIMEVRALLDAVDTRPEWQKSCRPKTIGKSNSCVTKKPP